MEHVPVVDYDAPPPADAGDPQGRAVRKAKSKRYATRVKGFIADRDAGGSRILTFSHWEVALPALPVGRSAVVALGEVIDSVAHLSEDKTGVYSEFTIRIEETFKDDASASALPGNLMTAGRKGGRVRFPSGRVTLYGNRGQGMPRPGRRYVFFLERDDQQYSVLTAYEPRAGRVYPLDGKDAPGGEDSDWAGNRYQEADAGQFLRDVRHAVTQSGQPASAEGAVEP